MGDRIASQTALLQRFRNESHELGQCNRSDLGRGYRMRRCGDGTGHRGAVPRALILGVRLRRVRVVGGLGSRSIQVCVMRRFAAVGMSRQKAHHPLQAPQNGNDESDHGHLDELHASRSDSAKSLFDPNRLGT